MSELAMRPHDMAAQAAAVDVRDAQTAAPRWLLDCRSPSPFDREQTFVVTMAEPVHPITAGTSLARGVPSTLAQPIGMLAWNRQATQILPIVPDLPSVTLAVTSLPDLPPWRYSTQNLAGVFGAAESSSPELSPPAATAMLRELLRWVGGSAELVAQSLGASRRSVYNWLKGKPVRAEFGARVARLQLVLEPLGEDWHPDAIAEWLRSGDPAPSELAANERWSELEERVRAAVRPIPPQAAEKEAISDSISYETWPAEALSAALVEFNSPPPARARTTDWQPREFTGSTPGIEEE